MNLNEIDEPWTARATIRRYGLLLSALMAICGCSKPPPTELGSGSPPAIVQNEAEKLLAKMIEAYSRASGYADDGALIVSQQEAGTFKEIERHPFRLIFQRPNKIELYNYAGHLVCDGSTISGWNDEVRNFLVRQPAAPTIRFADLYRNEKLQGALVHGMAGESLPLAMLLGGEDAMSLIRDGHIDSAPVAQSPNAGATVEVPTEEFNTGERPELTEDGKIEDRLCRRVIVRDNQGAREYWIDAESLILRRIAFSARKIVNPLDPLSGDSDTAMTIEFFQASFNPRIDANAFAFTPRGDVRVVEVLPSLRFPPKPLSKTSPKALKMTEVWRSGELKKPEFALTVDSGEKDSRLIVADGPDRVAEFNSNGKLLWNAELDLPKQPAAAATTWRTAVDGDGKRYFVAVGPAQQQVHVFDADFKRLGSYPNSLHPGIADVQLDDIEGDGTLELLVGYWDDLGTHAMSLDGRRLWSTRENGVVLPEHVTHLALTGPDESGKRLLLCSTGPGYVVVLNEQGQTLGRPFRVGGLPTRLVVTADLTSDGIVEMCALTTDPPADTATGFSGFGDATWTYPLPVGIQASPTMSSEMVVGGKVLDGESGAWVFAGADGTIHLVAPDGKPIDSFAWGSAIRGLALGTIEGRATLFVSDAGGVSALQLSR